MRHLASDLVVLRQLGVNLVTGLSADQAKQRLARFGPNILTPPTTASRWLRLLRPFSDPMVLLLLGAGAVYFLLGEAFNAVVMLVAIVPIAAVDLVLEMRAESALEHLRKLSAPRADVKREGKWVTLPADQLVPGDLVRIEEGDVVPADGIIVTASDLQVDESSITGESQPVAKQGTEWPPREIESEQECSALAGTTVLSGRGQMIVTRTGKETVQGEVGTLVAAAKPSPTATERAISQLVIYLGLGAGVLVVAVVLVLLVQGASLGTALISGISLGIAAIPEEFAIVFVLFLALGAYYLATRNALVRRLAAVETLGSVDTIATDKTGTLTPGRLSVSSLYAGGQLLSADPPPNYSAAVALIEAAVLASEPNPFDPLERAIAAYAAKMQHDPSAVYRGWTLVREYTFERQRLYMSHVWRSPDGRLRLCAKGAIEAILARSDVDPEQRQRVLEANDKLAGRGERVLAVAERYLEHVTRDRDEAERDLKFLGLIALADPPRPGVREAIEECQTAGIRVLMVTGDHPRTAHAIAEQIGLAHEDTHVITGAVIERLSPAQLHTELQTANIFARVLPAQKYRLVELLKRMNHVVAVTGDGVNDAPALRIADIGIAMGQRGTDVARAAAAMILLDDNFSTIVDAIRQGRRIFQNLQKAFRYLIAFHLPVVLLALLVPLAGLPLLLLPIQLVWLELLIHPTASLVFLSEPPDPGTMRRPPRKPDAPFLQPREVVQIVTAGAGLLVVTLGIYAFNLAQGQPAPVARALALGALILGNAALAQIERTGAIWQRLVDVRSNRLAVVVLVLAVLSFVLIVYVPALAAVFELAPPPPQLWLEPVVLIGLWSALTLILRSAGTMAKDTSEGV